MDLPGTNLEGVVADIESAGGKAAPADVTRPDLVSAATTAVQDALGPLSLAVKRRA